MSPSRLLALLLPALALLALGGCTGETFLTGPGSSDDLFPEFNQASLVVHSPAPAAILLVDEPIQLDASVLNAAGEELDFDGLVWETDTDGLIHEGRQGEISLDWGIRTVTVTADLPNGSRLQTILGGIRIQGRHAGIYSGSMAINLEAEFENTPITASCLGGLDFTVDMSGEILAGENGSCTVNLFVMGEIDLGYGLSAEVEDDTADGDIQVDTGFFDLPVAFEGQFDGDQMTADFEGGAVLFQFNGSINAQRVSLYVDP